ncbi:MAG: hypothetical protein U1E17_01215 [Geminicoccaceae bacterium]
MTGIYVLVALAGTGAQPWESFAGQERGLAVILRNITGAIWPSPCSPAPWSRSSASRWW